MAVNYVIEQGRLVADPDIRATKDGSSFTRIRIAVDRNYKDGGADFFDVVAWSGTADFIGKYFEKGDSIIVSGELRTRDYETRSGEKRNAVEINAVRADFCSSRKDKDRNESGGKSYRTERRSTKKETTTSSDNDFLEVEDDDLPPFMQ